MTGARSGPDASPRSDQRPVAAVVGGGGGIGLGIALAYYRRNYRLALIDFDTTRLDQAKRRLGEAATGYVCDITAESAVGKLTTQLLADYGRVDDVIHAAGLTHVSRFDQTEPAVIRRVMEVNFFGVAEVTRRLLPALEATQGRIVVLSSVCGFAPLVGRTGYCASKYALHGWFESLRCETAGRGVSATLVCPSFVDTEFASRGLAGDGARLGQRRLTAGQLLAPEEMGEKVCQAALRRRKLMVLSRSGRLSYWVSRLAPGLYQRLMARQFREILESNQ